MAPQIIIVDAPTGDAAQDTAAIKDAIQRANAAYQEALKANPSAEQVVVQLAVGTYVVTGDQSNPSVGAVELLSGVALTGAGMGKTVIQLVDNFNARLNGIVRTALEDVSNVSVSGLTIDGNRDNNTTGDPLKDHQAGFICGVKAEEGETQTNITLSGVEIKECTAYGFNPHEISYEVVIENCVAHDNGKDGFVADGVVGGVYKNNVAYNNDRHGFNIQNASTDIVLENNTAYNNGLGATGGAGIVVQRGDIQRGDEAEIAHVTDVQIIGGEYYGNTREGILVKLSDDVTITGAKIYDNMRQGVRIEGSVNTILQKSSISNNSQERKGAFDEVQIRLREDYPDGNPDDDPTTNPVKNYYSTGTQVLNNIINPEDARYAIREEPTNTDGGSTGTVITGNAIGGVATDGPDTLTGSAGVDTLAGGKGDDTYYVNKDGDVVTENPNEGTDHVFASAKHILSANVEKLTLTGIAAINGYGNELNNVVTGNDAANTLEGLGGADTIIGAGGNDTLKGGAGNDSLDGGVGADSMVGGDGDDIYIVDETGDLITERADGGLGGYDRVFSSVSYTLADEVEELTLAGTANLSATGNTGANVLNGNAGNNIFDGRGGADTITGGLGDDTYYVDHTGDIVVEAAGAGTDTIISSISIVAEKPLAANVEKLVLIDNPTTGISAVSGVGNNLDNEISGNKGNNKLYGQDGNDTLDGGASADELYGGLGNDTFRLRKGEVSGDTIFDFKGNGALDKLEFVGFSDQATLAYAGGNVWRVTDTDGMSEQFSLKGVTSLASTDVTGVRLAPATGQNQAPTAVALVNQLAQTPENGLAVKVADIATTDDGLGTNLLALVGADAGAFEIRGSELWFKGGADYEAKPSYAVQVKVSDSAGQGEVTSAEFRLAISNVNDNAPVITTANVHAVAENQMLVAVLAATDADAGSTPATFSLSGGADADLFRIDGGNLVFKTAPDYEAGKTSYQVEVSVSDGLYTTKKMITVNLTNVAEGQNQAPTAVALVNPVGQTAENGSAVKVADIVTTDDGLGANNLSLVGSDAGAFEIRGSELWFKGGADYEVKQSYAAQVKATDTAGQGEVTSPEFRLAITDVKEDTQVFDFRLSEATFSFNGPEVVINGPGGQHFALSGFKHFQFADGTVNEDDGNASVSDLFYYAQNVNVWNAGIDADDHYAAYGWREGRDPNAFFSTNAYLSANQDV
ncbi:right-handed parallel beta-helix repeat-containing protein, partial [Microvirga sp. BT688]|uniref:right-handed parallel beta-helix repeat-containing protein n=1 Tax=Microvirga sp. TaxID=1873136 RepID=UPI0016870BA3